MYLLWWNWSESKNYVLAKAMNLSITHLVDYMIYENVSSLMLNKVANDTFFVLTYDH